MQLRLQSVGCTGIAHEDSFVLLMMFFSLSNTETSHVMFISAFKVIHRLQFSKVYPNRSNTLFSSKQRGMHPKLSRTHRYLCPSLTVEIMIIRLRGTILTIGSQQKLLFDGLWYG